MLPPNFSFIDNYVAGSAAPYSVEELQSLVTEGITDVFTLIRIDLSQLMHNHNFSLQIHNHAIYAIPDPKTINAFLTLTRDIRQSNRKLLVHCQYGQERTGIMLAIYLKEYKQLAIQQAIEQVQKLRPGSLRTYNAYNFLMHYY